MFALFGLVLITVVGQMGRKDSPVRIAAKMLLHIDGRIENTD
jgi:hypothetical protein